MRARIVLIAVAAAFAALISWLATRADVAPVREAAATDSVELTRGSGPERLSKSLAVDAAVERDASSEPERSVAARRGFDVRVVHEYTRVPLEDFDVEMSTNIVLGHGTSDRTGTIHFAEPTESGARLIVTAPYGWVVKDRVRPIAPAADGIYRDVEVLAHQSGFARFRARLVDDRSFEPVPHYLVRIGTDDGSRESVVSDAEGRLVSAQTYSERTLMLFFHDVIEPESGINERRVCHYLQVEHVPIDDETSEVELQIPVGPTYRLTIEAPEDVRTGPLYATFRWLREMSPPPQQVTETHVRRSGGDWVRFRPERRWIEGSIGSFALVIASKDGRWIGETMIDTSRRISDVNVRLEARGGVMVRVLDTKGAGIANAHVELAPALDGGPATTPITQKSSGNGLAEFTLLAPGAYRVEAISPAHERRFLPIVVAQGERNDVDIVLPDTRLDGEIAGRVILAAGDLSTHARLSLVSRRPEGRFFVLEIPFEVRGEEKSCEFAFRNLPQGDYSLSARPSSYQLLAPSQLEVSTSTRDIVFRSSTKRFDPSLSIDLEFRIFDAEDGKPLAPILFHSLHPDEADFGEVFLTAPPFIWTIDRAFDPLERWTVGSPGHESVEVELSSAQREGELYVVTARLPRGFGFDLECIGPNFRPLAGVHVLVDGSKKGETDSAGKVHVALEEKAARIELDYRGWIVEPSSRALLAKIVQARGSIARVFLSPQ